MHRALEATCRGCLLLAFVQLPGALLDYFLRSDIGPPELLMGSAAIFGPCYWRGWARTRTSDTSRHGRSRLSRKRSASRTTATGANPAAKLSRR
jgi:hypothetical protein